MQLLSENLHFKFYNLILLPSKCTLKSSIETYINGKAIFNDIESTSINCVALPLSTVNKTI